MSHSLPNVEWSYFLMPFENQTVFQMSNGFAFKSHLEKGQICPDFEWSEQV
jgi:hypothetical protein